MLFGTSTWTGEITSRMKSVIVAANVLPDSTVIDYNGEIEDLMNAPGQSNKFAVIAPMEMPVNQQQVIGGGAEWTPFDALWRIDICMRVLERDNQTAKLLSQNLDKLTFDVIAALQIDPVLKSGTGEESCLRQPLRLVRASYNPRRPKSGWAYCRTLWQAFFRADFTAAFPG